MRFRFVRALLVCAAALGIFLYHETDSAVAVSTGVVISQIYGGGGATTGSPTYKNDYIELFNRGTADVSLSGMSVQYASSTGNFTQVTTLPAVTLHPGQYFLVQEGSATGALGAALPVTPDVTGSISMSATTGKVALVNATTAVGTTGCPNPGTIVDLAGYGSGANCSEGTPTATLSNSTAALRAAQGCTDTDTNSTDFAVQTPLPRNTASPLAPCAPVQDDPPSVTSTTPSAGATGVAINSTVQITFSEIVKATDAAFTLECPAGTPQTFSQNPVAGTSTTTVTLIPAGQLPAATACAVKVLKGEITDVDGTPDQMVNDYSFTFTTLADAAPAVTTTSPLAGATNVPINTQITINFSESVTATANAFTLQCPAGTPISMSQSASPAASFTLASGTLLPYATTCTVTVVALEISDTDTSDPPDHPASNVTFSFTTALPPGADKVIINEIDADTPGSPQDLAEFVELYDGGVGNTPLDGLIVVFYDGGTHTSYATFDLTGRTTNANGYFTLGNPGVPNVDLPFGPGEFGFLQNGPDAVALYAGNANAFPNGTAIRTTNLVDAIVYGTDDSQDSGLKALLNAGQLQVNENATGDGPDLSLQRCPNGAGGTRNTASYYPGAPTPGAVNVCPSPRPASTVVISQLYGGGGNSGAQFHNDFVELFNRSNAPVDLTGWSLQYTSSAGNSWDANVQPLGGTIGAGEYYLIGLGAGTGGGTTLPSANITGQINMSASAGKVALVSSFNPLVGGCPIFDTHLMDFVGYGAADCGESLRPAPGLSNTTALFRKSDGATDTDNNSADFLTGAPNPNRRTAPIVELGPLVLTTDPRPNASSAPRDATIEVTFTEPVDAVGAWFDIMCARSGRHDDGTFAGEGQNHYITPNVNFIAGETCTVTIFKDQVHDQDTDDSAPNTDTLPANYVWSFTVASGAPPPYPPSVHLTMGNPSAAIADITHPNNYLMEKPEYALSYNRDMGRPNWVSWHLSDEWIGTLARVDTFRPDPAVPPDWYRVQSFDFSGSGFDRGHMTPNADRDNETSIPINQATYLMSNMVAQAPGNNQGPWAAFEAYLRTLLPADELYIVSGPAGTGGTGGNTDANGLPFVTNTLASRHVIVPQSTWKVALVLPKNTGDDVSRVDCSTRTIAVIMPNDDGIRADDWAKYLTTVDAVETLTGYDFFSNLPEPYQACIEAGTNGNNPPLVKGTQTIAFPPPGAHTYGDPAFVVTATGGKSGNPVTFAASGVCASTGTNGATITLTGAGSCAITASQAGSVIYDAADPVTVSVDVAKATPAFSNLGAPTIEAGTTATTIGGVVSLGSLVPTGSVSITLGGSTQSAVVGSDGRFAATFATAGLAPSAAAYALTFTYSGDGNFNRITAPGSLRVQDTTPPVINGVAANPDSLAPPNHNMIDVTLAYRVVDLGADGHTIVTAAPSCGLSITSNEPVNGTNDGNTSVDWQVIDAHHVQLRAERSGTGTGRLYTIGIRCTDAAGNPSSAAATVSVPK